MINELKVIINFWLFKLCAFQFKYFVKTKEEINDKNLSNKMKNHLFCA